MLYECNTYVDQVGVDNIANVVIAMIDGHINSFTTPPLQKELPLDHNNHEQLITMGVHIEVVNKGHADEHWIWTRRSR